MPKTADVIAARLRTFILASKVLPGSQLPSERELIERFKVSRASIREALRILEAEGLIEVRRGVNGGVFAVAPSGERLSRTLATLVAHRQTPLSDLLEMRLLLEPEAAASVARRASAEERGRLLAVARQSQPDDMVDQTDFHVLLGELSGNGLLALFLGALRDIVAEAASSNLPTAQELERNKRVHIRIAEAIVRGDQQAARQTTERHIRSVIQYLLSLHDAREPIISLNNAAAESGRDRRHSVNSTLE